MAQFRSLFANLGLTLLWVWLPALQSAPFPDNGLMGTVKTSDGKALEGVAVSARAKDKMFTTSVYTDKDGVYFFPPLDNGQYRIWAQAVGFELVRSEQTVSSGKRTQQDFALKPFADFHKQLSDSEWMDSLPDATVEDRRMKKVFGNTCGGCHESGFVLEKRFDAAGWQLIVNYMTEKVSGETGPARQLLEFYKQDLVAYLTRVRGPKPYPLNFKPIPRPTGDATGIVVTEYDIPFGDEADDYGNYDYKNGSDWSKGIRATTESLTHDAMLSTDGNVYLNNSPTPERTIGKLDPKTGHYTSLRAPGLGKEEGMAAGTQFGNVDRNGNLWLTSTSSKMIIKFDPKTQTFQRFPQTGPPRSIHGGGAVDAKGNVWFSQDNGAIRLNPGTGEYTEFKSITKAGRPYDLVLDAENNAWFSMIAVDRVGVVYGSTGEVSEVVLPPLDEEIDAKDREIGQRSGAWTDSAPIFQKGPRRMGADPNGDTVWVGEFWAGRLAKIDIHTRKVTEYKVPYRYSHPYKIAVDKNHMVWFGMANADLIGKFNPITEQFSLYQLPTRGTNSRHISLDNNTDIPTIWVPYTGSNKIARVQFRTIPAH